MTPHTKLLFAAVFSTAIGLIGASPSYALSAKECSAKYNTAKADGTLGQTTWNDFRKAQCGDGAAPAAEAKDTPAVKTTQTTSAAAATSAVFPKAVDPKYAKEKAGKARMYSCRDQYKLNKATNANGGMKWIQKGGGYYSLCNKTLKAVKS